MSNELAWRMEAAFLDAWPALARETVGDWLVQFGGEVSRRADSANPRAPHIRDLDSSLSLCAQRYQAAGKPALFRLPSIVDPAIDARLDVLGYSAEGETFTLYADMASIEARRDADVALASRPTTDWLAAIIPARGHTGEQARAYRQIVGSIAIPAAFAAAHRDGQPASLAYGAVQDGFLMIESVVTVPAARGQGLAYRTLKTLLAWGADRGAKIACLQVAADNAPALALYRRLGLRSNLYSYHYRRGPQSG